MRSQLAASYVTIGIVTMWRSRTAYWGGVSMGSGDGDRQLGSTTVRRHPFRPQLRLVAHATTSDFRGLEPRCP